MWIAITLLLVVCLVLFVKLGGIANLKQHFQHWAEGYWWLPVSLLFVIVMARFHYLLTGRLPLENGFDWTGVGQKFFVCILLILLLSIRKEAGGVWMTKEEQIQSPSLAWKEAVVQIVMACLFAYIITKG
jgi:hypothetical protein